MMQRVFLWFFSLLALYVSGFACATEEPPLPPDEKPAPHIALLLPLKSAAFAPAADAVRQGFLAAAGVEVADPRSLPVRVYASFDEGKDIVALYRQAVASGARAVVGPLTRNGVATLAAEKILPVPTLALNVADQPASPQLYFFGMALEAEARQTAKIARRQGAHQAIVVTVNTQLSRRLQTAFAEELTALGGTVLSEIEFSGDPAVFADIADQADTVVFLAADAATARLVRPYLPNRMPIHATSQIFIGNANTLVNNDLERIRFVDMPWLLQPDHPAVMVYPRATPPLAADNERFYALGIDAFRLIHILLEKQTLDALPLDGVSGHIDLDHHTFLRSAIPATFVQGHAQLPNMPATVVPMFPGLMSASSVPEAGPPQ
ncbi:MAG: penicillin-binding protein activator [Gallionella sp.]|nr:penicillin-binding protein activator [Gallionella sp.]